jgi:PAS domain-containing protein
VTEVIRKPYFPPRLKELSLGELSPQVRKLMPELGKLFSSNDAKKTSLGDKFRIILDLRGNCLAASEPFCKLLGYSESSLVGTPVDSFTPPNLLDVPKNLGFVFHYGAIQGLWMFLHKNSTWILVRHESELLPNLSIQMRLEPLKLYEAMTGKT